MQCLRRHTLLRGLALRRWGVVQVQLWHLLSLLAGLLVVGLLLTPGRPSNTGEGAYSYQWPRPRLSVDPVVVLEPTQEHPRARVLLVKRKSPPFKGYWGVPGGYVNEHERLPAAVIREVKEETSLDLSNTHLAQVAVFDDPDRDGRGGWSVGVTYAALLPASAEQLQSVQGGDDAAEAAWHDVLDLPVLAFDHKQVIRAALRHLATDDRVKGRDGLLEQLEEAASKLAGAWQHLGADS